jgi:hypothetical protein
MSDELGLLNILDQATTQSLLSYTTLYAERPVVADQWHVCLQTPLLGQVSYSFNDLEGLRRELSHALPKLVLGKIHVYYGKALPVFSDGSGGYLYVLNSDGQEVPITSGQDVRIPVTDRQFSFSPQKLNIDELL